MRILVTGSRGQVSRSLIERAGTRTGMDFVAVGRPELDLEQPGSAERIIADVAPDVVINAAAYTAVDQAESEPDRAFRVNADGAGEAAAAARRIGVPIVQISTDYVFDGSAREPYDEAAAPNPLNVYGRSKLEGEEQVRAANRDHLILRTSWVFSPFGHNFVKSMIAAAEQRDELSVVDDQSGCPTSALDFAEGILVMLERFSADGGEIVPGTYNLAGSSPATWFSLAREIMRACAERGRPSANVRPIATADWPAAAARPMNSRLDSSKFARDFGYWVRPWEECLPDIVDRLTAER
jgi:dTDP-4-dehydrorhamnose reductase